MKQIRAFYTDTTIRVYQAYNKNIADEVMKNGTFGKSFNLDRMTWIKTSFLWMMYWSGWGTKENQENILAIDLQRDAFDFLVKNAVDSKYMCEKYESYDDWKNKVNLSDIRVQWDPERDIWGTPLEKRSIQIGIRGQYIKKYVYEWIVNITDISDYVKRLKIRIEEGRDISDMLPKENIYEIK